jgi:hypothetical protein
VSRPSRFEYGLSQIARVENGRIWKPTIEIKRSGARDVPVAMRDILISYLGQLEKRQRTIMTIESGSLI